MIVTNNTTLILQSYRTENVAPWIRTCLESVRMWAESRHYRYEFVDDHLFDYVSPWVKKRCRSTMLPVTDIARLHLIKDRLSQMGVKRVVWIDADVIIFSPGSFTLNPSSSYSFSREFWVHKVASGMIRVHKKINNSVMFFTKDQPVLDFLIFAAEEVIHFLPEHQINPLSVGTTLLSRLSTVFPMQFVTGATTFSPSVILDVAQGGGAALTALQAQLKHTISAANLCGSLINKDICGVLLCPEMIEKAIQRLQSSHGIILNKSSLMASRDVAL